MKQINRILAFLLCAVMLLSLLAGCRKTQQVEAPKTRQYVSLTQGIDFNTVLGSVTEYSVVISSMATESEKYAAETLMDYVAQITGVTMPYGADSAYTDSKIISVGRTAFLDSSGLTADADTLGTDGFVVKNKGNALLICGGSDRGTIYGVLDFLEYHLGVKFLTADYTHIPAAEEAMVYACDRTEIPAFDYRVYLDADAFYNDNPEINLHHRFTSEYIKLTEEMGGNIKWFQDRPTHNALYWAQTEKYTVGGVISPEYMHAFANDGERILIDPKVLGEYTQYAADLCYTDGINEDGSVNLVSENGTPTAIAMAIEGMKDVIRNDKGENNYYMFGQNDTTSRPCLCQRCRAASAKYTDTGIMIRFFNVLSDAIQDFVEEEGIQRQVSIIMFAYLYSAFPPVKQTENGSYEAIDPTCIPRKEIVIRLAPITMNRFVSYEHEAQNSTSYSNSYMTQWASIANNFMLWEYTTYHTLWYWFYPTRLSWYDKLVTARDMGVQYVMLQGTYQEYPIYQSIEERYVSSKLMWNPEYDINEITQEFYRYYFGEAAAPYAAEYVQSMTAACYEALEDAEYYYSAGLTYADKGLLKFAIATLDEGVAAVEGSDLSQEQKDVYIRHLEIAKLQPRYMYLYNYMQYETDEVQMKIEVRKFIEDTLSYGGQWCLEGKRFDLENLVFY